MAKITAARYPRKQQGSLPDAVMITDSFHHGHHHSIIIRYCCYLLVGDPIREAAFSVGWGCAHLQTSATATGFVHAHAP